MAQIQILIVDDSNVTRAVLREILTSQPDMEVVGEASTGEEALEMAGRLRPDIITMDISMPGMSGMEAIELIMESFPAPILVVTSLDEADIAYQAINHGALEVMKKPSFRPSDQQALVERIRLLSQIKVIRHLRSRTTIAEDQLSETLSALPKPKLNSIVVGIAASTGGPRALATILSSLPPHFAPPILIAQHIGGGFSAGLSSWLDHVSPLRVKLAVDGEKPLASHVYLPPDGRHLLLQADNTISLVPGQPKDRYIPSADRLFFSLASSYGRHTIGIVLTGMGNDGTQGLALLHKAGAVTIAQDEATSAVFGMPASAVKAGVIQSVLPLEKIPEALMWRVHELSQEVKG
ncbi:MAG: chemotaxis-specific protein-glutamate methyltransferase CheB [Spirochaetota bacterium]